MDLARVFDAHVHIQPWHMFKPSIRARMEAGRSDLHLIQEVMASPDRCLAFLDREGVESAVLVNYVSPDVMGFTAEVNRWVADFCRDHPDRLIAMGSVHPRFSKDPAAEMNRLMDLGIRAIKIHPAHQLLYPNDYRRELPGLAEVYRAAEKARVPVMIHTGTSIFVGARNTYADPIYCDDVAVDFPELKIILAHGGRPLWMETAFFLVRRHPNVYFDLSSIPPSALLRYFPRLEEVAAKALFGTDWPAPGVPGIKDNIEAFKKVVTGQELQKKILWENARKVFSS